MSNLIKYQPRDVILAKPRETQAIERWKQAALLRSGQSQTRRGQIWSDENSARLNPLLDDEDPFIPDVEVLPPQRSAAPLHLHIGPQTAIERELMRACAVHDAIWIARYVKQPNGVYVFSGSFWLDDRHGRNYEPDVLDELSDFKADKEQCPCGAYPPVGSAGSVWCATCSAKRGVRICYGRTSPSGFFQCRDSCGARGQLVYGNNRQFAIRPGLRR